VNLYAVCAEYAPFESDTHLFLARSHEEALDWGVFIAAKDATGIHGSTKAEVFLIQADVHKIGDSYAAQAPAEWKWAHPGVEDAIARDSKFRAEAEAACS